MKAKAITPRETENTRKRRVRRSSRGRSLRWSTSWRQTKEATPATPTTRAAYAGVWSPGTPTSLRP